MASNSLPERSTPFIEKAYGKSWSYGIPEKLQKDFKCSVEDSVETSEWFDVLTGVKQGCKMSGFLFLLAMD